MVVNLSMILVISSLSYTIKEFVEKKKEGKKIINNKLEKVIARINNQQKRKVENGKRN